MGVDCAIKELRMVKDQRKFIELLAVFFAGLLAGIGLIIFHPSKSEPPPPDTSKLRDLLLSTAQKNMGVPPLTDIGLELSIERDRLDKEVERIKSLATKFGGTAVVGTEDEKGMKVLAQISPRWADEFVEAVKHPEKEPDFGTKAEGDSSPLLVEIRLTIQG